VFDEGEGLMRANRVPLSPVSFLDRSADIYPDRIAVVRPDATTVTYAGLREHAGRLAGRLRALAGGRVAMLALNDLPLLAAHFGAPAAGSPLVAMNTRLAADEYRYILNHCRAEVLLVDAPLLDRLGPGLREAAPHLRQVVQIGGEPVSGVDSDYEEWLGPDDGLALPSDEDDPISVNYTSGRDGRAARAAPCPGVGVPVDAADVPLQRLVLHVGGDRRRGHPRVPAQLRGRRGARPDGSVRGHPLLRGAGRVQLPRRRAGRR
jgi:hypothetical protein